MSVFEELKRRNVFRVGVAYVVGAWLLLQLTDVLSELLDLPSTVGPTVVTIVLIGLPIVLFVAWAFELTPEGIKREEDVDRSASLTGKTGRKLDRSIIVMLLVALGYFVWEARFNDDVPEGPSDDPEQAAISGAQDVPAEASLAQALDNNSIAVLPFANRSNNDDDQFFTDGIHDDLLTQLAKLDDLKVISRTSVMEYRATTKKIVEIAEELGVGTILEGGVQRAGNRIRINAQLIDVSTDQHLWAETFDREMTIDNIFDIQSEITREIVSAIRGEMTESESAQLADRPTNSLEAWEAFTKAKAVIRDTPDYSQEKYEAAQVWMERALAADPNFTEAWATQAMILLQGIWIGYANTDEQRALVRAALDRAIELGPNEATTLQAQADYEYRVNLNYEKTLQLLQQAQAIEPGNTSLLEDIATVYRRLGRWEDSANAYREVLTFDPFNGFVALSYAETLGVMNAFDRLAFELQTMLLRHPGAAELIGFQVTAMILGNGDVDGAERYLDGLPENQQAATMRARLSIAFYRRDFDTMLAMLEMDEAEMRGLPVFHRTKDLELAGLLYLKGEVESARPRLQGYLDTYSDQVSNSRTGNAFRLMNLANAKSLLGEHEAALDLLDQSNETLDWTDDAMFGLFLYQNSVLIRAMAGQRDLALEMIAADLDQPGGFNSWDLYLSPTWDFFRDDERFNELIRPSGLEPEPFRNQRLGDGT